MTTVAQHSVQVSKHCIRGRATSLQSYRYRFLPLDGQAA